MLAQLVGVHSLLRWVVLLVATIALVRGLVGWLGGGAWTELDRGLTRAAGGIISLQVLLGIVIWVVERRWGDGLFLGVVHPLVMLGALGIVQVGSARIKRASDGPAKHRTLALSLLLALVLITAAIPPDAWSRAWVG